METSSSRNPNKYIREKLCKFLHFQNVCDFLDLLSIMKKWAYFALRTRWIQIQQRGHCFKGINVSFNLQIVKEHEQVTNMSWTQWVSDLITKLNWNSQWKHDVQDVIYIIKCGTFWAISWNKNTIYQIIKKKKGGALEWRKQGQRRT